MTVLVGLLIRQHDALLQAEGLIDELKAQAVGAEDYVLHMVVLCATNPDMPILVDARNDPENSGPMIAQALDDVRRSLASLAEGAVA